MNQHTAENRREAAPAAHETAPPTSRGWLRAVVAPVPLAFAAGILITGVVGAFGVPYFGGWQAALTGGLVLLFLMGAVGRLGPQRAGLIAMVPNRFPRPDLIVAATGILEAAGAIGLLLPPTHRLAALCLAALLVAVFPANVKAARSSVGLAGRPATPLVPRAVVQAVYLAACLAVALA
ncbi:DoxX family protein [Humibacter sp. RRB41]|uniref:DoxX family protein n=1 Tax=Humibacter sp. RRB41 TaxID=2919946 RepID=UPI001FA94679|nr:DoxX family protein [Humibacter sp. RRB41]